jgi:16S rRNA (guanine1207-N2)-methyltransferase
MVRNFKEEHYFSESPSSELKERSFKAVLKGKEFFFHSGAGIFCPDKIDNGTFLLIEKCIVKNKQRILDLGCGYGAVGVVIAKIFPESEVVMSDINERAVMFAKKNCEINKVKAVVIKSYCFENIKEKFDVILLNPPQTAGKDVCFQMIEESKKFLKKKGSLQLVARSKKGGKSLEAKMKEVFGNVKVIARGSGYKVYFSSA